MKARVPVYITDSAPKGSRGHASPPYPGDRVYSDPRTMHDHGGHMTMVSSPRAGETMHEYADPYGRIHTSNPISLTDSLGFINRGEP